MSNENLAIDVTNEQLVKEFGISEDLLPTQMKDRNWGIGNYATLWLGSVHNIPNYMTIGGFFALGLSVYQVFGAIMGAAIILASAIIINSKIGVKYGIPFSMALKVSYGNKGAILPGFLRGCVAAIMWFGFQTFAGSEALTILISKFWPGFLNIGAGAQILGISIPQLISFLLFWTCNISLIYGGMDAVGKFAKILSPVVYIVFGGMAIWAVKLAGGVGAIMSYTPKGIEGNSFIVILGCMSAILATWAAPIVSIADISRNAKSQKDQIIGNTIGLIAPYILFAIASIAIIVGSEIAFGTPIWNVIDVINKFDSTFAIGISVLTLCMTTLSVNIVGNIIPAGYQLAALFPKKLNFRKGALIAGIIAVLIMPWKLAENSTSIFVFLNTIGGLLGPVSGVMLADYFIVNKQEIDIYSLYSGKGEYEYSKGYNKNAYIATIVAGVISLIGQLVPSMKIIYDISWIAGISIGFILYALLMKNKK